MVRDSCNVAQHVFVIGAVIALFGLVLCYLALASELLK